jgi:hypothetical protein
MNEDFDPGQTGNNESRSVSFLILLPTAARFSMPRSFARCFYRLRGLQTAPPRLYHNYQFVHSPGGAAGQMLDAGLHVQNNYFIPL